MVFKRDVLALNTLGYTIREELTVRWTRAV